MNDIAHRQINTITSAEHTTKNNIIHTMKITHKILNKFRLKTTLPSNKLLEDEGDCSERTRRASSSEEFDPADFPLQPAGRRSIRMDKKDEDDDDRPRIRLVCFDEEILVRRVRPVYEIGGAIDRRELWYQDDEYKEIMWKARKSVKRARNFGGDETGRSLCVRGLEYVSSSSARRRSNLDGREAVLDEQFLQFQRDVFPLDDRKIASMYAPFTATHRTEALERGRSDAAEVRAYLRAEPCADRPPFQPSRVASLTSVYNGSSSSLQSLSTTQQQQQTNTTTTAACGGHSPGMVFTYMDKIGRAHV